MAHKPLLWYGRHKLLFWVIAGLLVLYALAGFVVAPMVIEHLLHTRISQSLQRKIQADTVRVNPLTFSIRLAGLTVADRDGSDFVKISDFFVNLDPLSSLFKWGIVIQSIVIHEPQLQIVRLTADRFNFSDLMPTPPEKAVKEAPAPARPLRLVLGNLNITAGRLRFVDHAQGMPFESSLSALTVGLSGLDTQAGAEACRYRLSARSETDETLELEGEARIQPFAVQAKVDLKQLVPSKYAPYYQPVLNARIADGRIDLRAAVQWSDGRQRLDDLKLAVSNLALDDASGQQRLVRLPQFGIEGADIDLKAHRIGLGRITSQDGTLNVRRDARGQLNLLTASKPRSTQQEKPAENKTQASPENPSAWQINLPELVLSNYSVEFQDLQPTPAVQTHLRQISFTARNLSTQPQQQGQVDLALQWADQGTLSARGQAVLDPLQVELDVAAKALDIRPLQPYLQEFVQLVITKGLFDAQGHLNVAAAPQIRFTGQAALNSLEAVDADKAALFSKWKSLYLSGIEVQSAPLRVQVDKVALTDFFNRLLIDADGTVNVETIIGRKASADAAEKPADAKADEQKGAAAPTAPADGQEARIVIKTVTLQGGQIDYSDKYIKPNVHLIMKELGGRISGLDNIKQNRADVLLRGVVGSNLPMQIKGQVNPLIPKPYINLSLNFPGIDLSPFAPYSGKYIGYSLEKGQLAMNLSYKVVDNKLAGQNKIELNQLAFGDPVASPQATKLPVKLAVALLKDRQGNIDLDLPVSGDLNDPEFSLGGIILKMFVHLIREIVSAPFKMLGAIFGGGEELAYLDFDPGQILIAPQRTEKLDTLAKILFERPELKLEIQGQIDPETDTEGLRQQHFETELKATKLKALVAQGHKALPLDQIVLDPQERARMIRKAFDAATFPKPRDDKGQLKKLSPPEMEKLLYAATEVSGDDLRALAYQRASAAKAYLQSTGKIDPDRLFIVEPQIEGLKDKQGLKARVKFNLK